MKTTELIVDPTHPIAPGLAEEAIKIHTWFLGRRNIRVEAVEQVSAHEGEFVTLSLVHTDQRQDVSYRIVSFGRGNAVVLPLMHESDCIFAPFNFPIAQYPAFTGPSWFPAAQYRQMLCIDYYDQAGGLHLVQCTAVDKPSRHGITLDGIHIMLPPGLMDPYHAWLRQLDQLQKSDGTLGAYKSGVFDYAFWCSRKHRLYTADLLRTEGPALVLDYLRTRSDNQGTRDVYGAAIRGFLSFLAQQAL